MMDMVMTIAEAVAHNLWSVSWQVSILIAVIWLVDKLSWRASSLFKYWLWCIVLVRLCIPVSIELPTGIDISFTERIEVKAPRFRELPVLQTLPDEFEPLSPPEQMVLSESSVQKSFLPSLTVIQWFGLIWISAVTVIVLVLIIHVFVISRRLNRCKPVSDPVLVPLLEKLAQKIGLSRPVRLLYLDESIGDIPVAAGFLRPRIFLPPRLADNWLPEDLEPILLHELAHIRRSDLLVNWLQIAVQTVYFFHPLVWYANRRIRLLREEVCDDIAVHLTGDKRKRYTKSMLDVVKTAVREPSLGFVGIGFTERKSTLGARISRILSDTYRIVTRLSVVSVILLITIGTAGISFSCKKSEKLELDLNSILESIEISDNVILYGKGTLIWEYARVDTTHEYIKEMDREELKNTEPGIIITIVNNSIVNVFFAFKNQKMRCDENTTIIYPDGRKIDSMSKNAYDGETKYFFGLSNSGPNGETRQTCLIKGKNSIQREKYDPRYIGIYLYGEPLGNYIKNSMEEVELLGIESKNNEMFYVIYGKRKGSSTKIKLWISSKKMFRPSYLEMENKPWLTEIEIEYKQYDNNIWFPKQKIVNNYVYSEKYKEQIFYSKYKLTVNEDFEVNKYFSDEIFKIEFPRGSEVYDSRTGNSFIVE